MDLMGNSRFHVTALEGGKTADGSWRKLKVFFYSCICGKESKDLKLQEERRDSFIGENHLPWVSKDSSEVNPMPSMMM